MPFQHDMYMLSISNIHLSMVLVWKLQPGTPWGLNKMAAIFRHFIDDIFKGIFFSEDISILIKISQKFVLKDPIDNNAALLLVMAWCQTGDKAITWTNIDHILWLYGVIKPQDLIHWIWVVQSDRYMCQ